jgi:hypothetical protein
MASDCVCDKVILQKTDFVLITRKVRDLRLMFKITHVRV